MTEFLVEMSNTEKNRRVNVFPSPKGFLPFLRLIWSFLYFVINSQCVSAFFNSTPRSARTTKNRARLEAAYREAVEKGAELVLAPELFLCGYPPRDLLLRDDFVQRGLECLEKLTAVVGEVPLITGYVDRNPKRPGRSLRNAAAVIQNGKIIHRVMKSLLPTYDVFDEDRYFEPADKVSPIEINGWKIALTICEDIWNDADFWPERRYPLRSGGRPGGGGREADREYFGLAVATRQGSDPARDVATGGARRKGAAGAGEHGRRKRRADFRRSQRRAECQRRGAGVGRKLRGGRPGRRHGCSRSHPRTGPSPKTRSSSFSAHWCSACAITSASADSSRSCSDCRAASTRHLWR